MLPREGLVWDVDQWLLRGRTPSRLGRRYKLVVRWRDRSIHARNQLPAESASEVVGFWRARWNHFTQANELPANIGLYCWLDDCTPDDLTGCGTTVLLGAAGAYDEPVSKLLINRLERHRHISCLALPFSPSEQPTDPDMLYNALDLGISVALWLRCPPADASVFREVAATILARESLESLRETIWKIRREITSDDPTQLGNALVLLWDDPYRQPVLPPPSPALS